MSTTVVPASDAITDAPIPAFVWGSGRRAFSEFCGSISLVADNDIPESVKALWRAADEAIRSDVSYSIALAEESNKVRDKQQKRGLVPARAVGV